MFQTDVLSHHLTSCSWVTFHSVWEFTMCLIKSLLNMNVISHFVKKHTLSCDCSYYCVDFFSQCLQVNSKCVNSMCVNKLPPSFACQFTLLTSEHTVIMLWLNVHPQMFVRRSFNAAYGTGRHGDCKFVLLTIVLDVKYDDFSLPKTNLQV